MIRLGLELLRIIFLFFILGVGMGAFMKFIYGSFGMNLDNTNGAWFVGIAIYVLLFVFYRNKLQYSGFYKGEGKVNLPKSVTKGLVSLSILLLVLAPFIS